MGFNHGGFQQKINKKYETLSWPPTSVGCSDAITIAVPCTPDLWVPELDGVGPRQLLAVSGDE